MASVTRGVSLPLLARYAEVGAQRPPYVARFHAGLDGLRGGAATQLGQYVVHQQRGSSHRTELRLDEFMEFGESHANKLPSRHSHLCREIRRRNGMAAPARSTSTVARKYHSAGRARGLIRRCRNSGATKEPDQKAG